jgi:hypothetical protein
MSSQGGLVTRKQAVEAGMSTQQIDRLTRVGTWTVVRKGVYAETAYVASLTTVREQRLLYDRATSMRISSPHVRSHHSAAYVNGLDVLHERPEPLTHVTRPGIVGSHFRAGVKHHRAPYGEELVVDRGGIRTLNDARTAADIAREHGYRQGLVAADSALRAGTTAAELAAVAKAMKSWPNVTVVRDVLASAEADTDSIGETLTRMVVSDIGAELGLGQPEVQFGLSANGRTVWCDLRLGRQMFEFDGHLKYQRIDEGGLASTSPDEIVWFEKQRQDFVCGFNVGMSRIVWLDLFGIRLEQLRDRIRREVLDTCRRFGTDVSDLAQYRPRGARPRPRRTWVHPPAA